MKSDGVKWLSIAVLILAMINGCTNNGVDPSDPVDVPSITVTEPSSAGVTWMVNASYTIRWQSIGPVGDLVVIDLYRDTTKVQSVITETPNDGAYSWKVPLSVAGGNKYSIRIVGKNTDSVYGLSGTVTIVNNYDKYEPNDDPPHATLIDTSGTVQHHTIADVDTDWLKFVATQGRAYCIQAQGSADPYLKLYEPNATSLITGNGNAGADSNAIIVWTCNTGGTYYCKVTSSQSGSLLPYSVSVRAGGAFISILSPEYESSYYGGSTIPILWTQSLNIGNHVSLYLYSNDTLVETIGKTIYNSGSCSWPVPYALPTSSKYRIKIVAHNDTSINDYSEYFSIRKSSYSINVTSPTSSTKWSTGTNNTITWNTTGSFDFTVDIDLYDSVTYIGNIAQNIDKSDNSYSFRAPSSLQTSTSYRIKITNRIDTAANDFSSYFTITHIPSSIEIIAPSATSNWKTGTQDTIAWTYTGNVGNFVRLELCDSTSVLTTIAGGASTSQKSFIWSIPPNIATGKYRIKTYCVEDTTLYDFGEFFTITKIPANITVTSPCSTDVWDVISTYTIRWSSTALAGSYAEIELYNDTTLEMTISPNTAINDSTLSWSIPSNLAGGSRYRIKMTCISDSTVYDFCQYFTIIPIPNRITVTSPTATSLWNTGSTCSIKWTYTLNPGPYVKIELYDSSSFLRMIDSGVSTSSQSYSWVVPSNLDTSELYQIRVSSTTIDSVFDLSDTFTIVYLPSGINITSPTIGTNWTAGSSYYINWNSVGNIPGSYVSIQLYDSTTWVRTIATSVSRLSNRYYWTLPVTLEGDTTYRIKMMSTTDTTVDGFSNYFTITEKPKRLTVTTPSNNSLWKVGENNSIYWTYSGSPGTHIKIELYDSSSFVQTVAASVFTTNGTCLWMVPASLQTSSKYQIRIASTTIDTVFDFSETFTIENPVIIDQYEPDSTYALATLIAKGDPVQTHALSAGDLDWLKFQADSGTTYTISTGGSLDTYLNLFGTGGTTLLTSDDDSGVNLNAMILWTCSSSGMYYFRVHGNFKGRRIRAGYYTASVQ